MAIHSAFRGVPRQVCAALVIVALTSGGLRAESHTEARGPANPATAHIHEEARRILHGLHETVYQHKTEIDEAEGVYRCDCSGLGIYILSQTVAKDDPRGPLGDGKVRPRAMHFYEAFAQAKTQADGGGRWQRIERIVDARPGDIIGWRREIVVPGNSGHVVIVDEQPVAEDDGLVRVVIIDSTTRPQVDDTRGEGESGVGRGTMWFKADDEGRPVAYVRGSRDAAPTAVRISIGRANPAKQTSPKRETEKSA
jgi:hypothetical protein